MLATDNHAGDFLSAECGGANRLTGQLGCQFSANFLIGRMQHRHARANRVKISVAVRIHRVMLPH